MKAAELPAVAVSMAEFSLLTPEADDLSHESMCHSTCDHGRLGPTHQLLPLPPMLTGRAPDEGAGDAVRMGSAIFRAMRSIMRSEATLSGGEKAISARDCNSRQISR